MIRSGSGGESGVPGIGKDRRRRSRIIPDSESVDIIFVEARTVIWPADREHVHNSSTSTQKMTSVFL